MNKTIFALFLSAWGLMAQPIIPATTPWSRAFLRQNGGLNVNVSSTTELGNALTNYRSVAGTYIYLAPGNYTNYAPMFIPTNGGLVGSGWSTKIFNLNTNGNNHQGGIIPTDGCTIENLLLTNAVSLSNQFCVGNSYVVDSTQPTARNVTIRNCAFYAHGDAIYAESPLTVGAAASLTNEYSCYDSLFYSDYDGITTIGANLGADNNPAFRFKFYNCDIICRGTNFINPAATMTPLNMGGASQGADTEVWLYGGRVECVNGPAGSFLVRQGISDYTGLHVYGTFCLVSNTSNGTINFPSLSTGYYFSTNGYVSLDANIGVSVGGTIKAGGVISGTNGYASYTSDTITWLPGTNALLNVGRYTNTTLTDQLITVVPTNATVATYILLNNVLFASNVSPFEFTLKPNAIVQTTNCRAFGVRLR